MRTEHRSIRIRRRHQRRPRPQRQIRREPDDTSQPSVLSQHQQSNCAALREAGDHDPAPNPSSWCQSVGLKWAAKGPPTYARDTPEGMRDAVGLGPPVGWDASCVLLSANQLPYVPGACQEPVGVFLLGAVDCVQADDVVPGHTIAMCTSHARSECFGHATSSWSV